MKLLKLETEILTRALENQKREHRQPPFWRPAVKCPLPVPPQEVGYDHMPEAIYENSGQAYQANVNPDVFLKQVKEMFGSEIAPARTNGLYIENFIRAGFIWAAGRVCWSRAEAEKVIEEWKKKAPWLQFFIVSVKG